MSLEKTNEDNGTRIIFSPDKDILKTTNLEILILKKCFGTIVT